MSGVLDEIRECGVIVVVRADDVKTIPDGIDAVRAGGCRAVEITFTVPDAVGVIRETNERFGDTILLGAGTVMNPTDAVAAVGAGAKYLVSPNTNREVIGIAKRLGVPIFPGAFTPTEVVNAWNAGADAVKIFPASLGGPSYLKALKGPLPDVPMVPTGGVGKENAADYIQAGAFAVGAGGKLFDPKLFAAGDYAEMTARAKAMVEAVHQARG